MDQLYGELFRAMGQFGKLRFGELFPDISKMDFFTMKILKEKEKGKQMTISELAAILHSLPSAVSRTLRGLEESGYVERTVNKKDRRNTYVELTEAGKAIVEECERVFGEFGNAVMARIDENELRQLIEYLDSIYTIAAQEIESRKRKDRKEREDG